MQVERRVLMRVHMVFEDNYYWDWSMECDRWMKMLESNWNHRNSNVLWEKILVWINMRIDLTMF